MKWKFMNNFVHLVSRFFPVFDALFTSELTLGKAGNICSLELVEENWIEIWHFQRNDVGWFEPLFYYFLLVLAEVGSQDSK